MNQVIFISGTPCVGKTTVASKLADELENGELIKINDLAIDNNFILGKDSEKDYKIVDIENLDLKLQSIIEDLSDKGRIAIVEGHLSHLCSHPDKVIVLRVSPEILEGRLASRDYSSEKIRENLEAEALAVCTVEAVEYHGDKVNEIDASDLSVDEIIAIIKEIIFNDKTYPYGEIDFMDWLLE